MKEYFVICTIDGEKSYSIKTEKSLAELWESNNEAGYIEEIRAYNPEDGLKKVDVEKIARSYIKEREAIQQEYEDYCEAVNEYGYDYVFYSDLEEDDDEYEDEE